jgi:hypothetical protein
VGGRYIDLRYIAAETAGARFWRQAKWDRPAIVPYRVFTAEVRADTGESKW